MEENIISKKSNAKFLLRIIICFALLFVVFLSLQEKFEIGSSAVYASSEQKFMYLSDIKYMNGSSVGWGSITMDKNLDSGTNGGLITLLVDGKKTKFLKGISAHATSTVLYDITNYDYDYFTAYIGVDNGRGSNGNGVKFLIYTSVDGTNWELKTPASPKVMKGNTNAEFVKIDIKEANYIKLYANNNGNDTADHAVYANAKLIKEDYVESNTSADFVKTVEEYDALIKTHYGEEIEGEYELLLLQRELVNCVGYDMLQLYAGLSENHKETLSWLFNDLENLRLYIIGGKPDINRTFDPTTQKGVNANENYLASLKVLNELYQTYKDDFEIEETTKYGTVLGDLYKRMAIALSLTHSRSIGLWMQPNQAENKSNAVVRYQIYKDMHKNGKFVVSSRQDHTKWFEEYRVEELRMVFNNPLDDEEILWLNEYTQKAIDAHPNKEEEYLQPHHYMKYIDPNFTKPIYHDITRKQEWSNKYGNFLDYGVTFRPGLQKLWMCLDNGAVCGGISKIGSNIRVSHGTPASVISQPGHAAIIYYRKNAQGQGYWSMDNDVFGWAQSGRTESLNYRMPLGWGNEEYIHFHKDWLGMATYVLIAQEAINDFDNYQESRETLILADVYKDDIEKLNEIYRDVVEVQPRNIDGWYGLIKTYRADETKTEADFLELSKDIMQNLKAYPLPMFHLAREAKKNIKSPAYEFVYTMELDKTLKEAKVITSASTIHWQAARTEANYLLGQNDGTLAKFSFDGADANKIILASRFDGNGVRWDYSIDGKQTWKEVSFDASEPHKWELTPEEVATITAENDIYIHIVGVDYSEDNLYRIDIKESAGLPAIIYANDWENKLIGATSSVEWKWNETDVWTAYKDAVPDLSGDKTIIARMGATGVYLAQKDSRTFNFTTNTDPDTRKYISIDHIGLHTFSTEASGQGRYARYAIDGNLNTSWHSNWNGNDPNKYISFKFDEPKNLKAIEYFPLPGGNGKILSAQILVSMDGTNWTEVVSGTNWTYANENDVSTKTVDFDPVKAQYVKIVGKRTQNSFIAAKMFNFYEDKTVTIVGTFSFDGNNAKKIVLDNDFKGQNFEYSLDGGNTWKNGSGDEHQLTDTEANQITAENQIKMRFQGNDIVYTIRIKETATPTISAYLNDLENRLIGIDNNTKNNLEWQIEGTNIWTDYASSEPVVAGAKKLYVRAKAKSNCTASGKLEFQFSEDANEPKRQYISISHLSVQGYTSQSKDASRPYYAPNAIDGNANTIWHTDFSQNLTGKKSFYTIKLDSTKYISAIEFIQKKYRDADPCFIKNVYVYISENNEDWIEAGRLENIPQEERVLRKIEFEENIPGQYVKIEMEGYDMFTSLAMVNLFEDTTLRKAATFSFDGENAGKIILEDGFKAANWEYSIDGGETWKQATGDNHTLTANEIEHINGDDEIKLRINNVEYVINILKSSTPEITAYLNDLENRLIGMNNTEGLEWKIEGVTQTWQDYSEKEPIVAGDNKLLIRKKAKNVFAASQAVEFNFTADNQADTRKYVSIDHLSIAGFSAEDKAQKGNAEYAIDGNYNTRWLNSSAGTDTEKYIIIKLDRVMYISAMDYVPHSENGKILTGKILGSMDGENFTEITEVTWANNQDTKTIDFEESVKVRYIKIIGVETSYVNAKRHVGARMFNFYEDTTKEEFIFNLNEYKIEDNYILGVEPGVTMQSKEGTTVQNFKEKIETNQNIVFVDKNGKTLGNEDVIGTGTILKVGEKLEYTIIALGDIDGNGMITMNDYAKLKSHYIHLSELEGLELKAADIDANGKISANDIARLRIKLIGEIN